MNANKNTSPDASLLNHLSYLKLSFTQEHFEALAQLAGEKQQSHVHTLNSLMEGDVFVRQERAVQRRINLARFPMIKTLEQFIWTWPKKINPLQVQNLFRLKCIEDKANVIFPGGVGLGKTHLATALAYAACLKGHSVLFTTALILSIP